MAACGIVFFSFKYHFSCSFLFPKTRGICKCPRPTVVQTDGDHARWVDNSILAWALLTLLNPATES